MRSSGMDDGLSERMVVDLCQRCVVGLEADLVLKRGAVCLTESGAGMAVLLLASMHGNDCYVPVPEPQEGAVLRASSAAF